MRRILIIMFVFLFTLVGCGNASYVNTKDNINDKDEAIIKEFCSHHGYSNNELKNLATKYLGLVDGYKIYYVPFKGENESDKDWIKNGYTFRGKSYTRIIGIKSNKLYTIGELVNETQINIKQLYKVLPEEFKVKK